MRRRRIWLFVASLLQGASFACATTVPSPPPTGSDDPAPVTQMPEPLVPPATPSPAPSVPQAEDEGCEPDEDVDAYRDCFEEAIGTCEALEGATPPAGFTVVACETQDEEESAIDVLVYGRSAGRTSHVAFAGGLELDAYMTEYEARLVAATTTRVGDLHVTRLTTGFLMSTAVPDEQEDTVAHDLAYTEHVTICIDDGTLRCPVQHVRTRAIARAGTRPLTFDFARTARAARTEGRVTVTRNEIVVRTPAGETRTPLRGSTDPR